MRSLSTHVLDAAGGGGRAGVDVTVFDHGGRQVAAATTDTAGRIAGLATDLAAGSFRIAWRTGGSFLSQVAVTVELDEDRHYHVPLLVSDVSAVTYLGV